MGIAIYKVRKSVAGNYISNKPIGELSLHEITYIISNMPPNTSIASINKSAIIGLYVEYVVELSNPIFKDGGVIEDNIQYMRDIAFTANGEMVQFDKNLGFNYTDVFRTGDDLKDDEEE